ncbi:hypothetical protein DUNSADRAFT_1002 [Dunaliella salina]|uniref:Encoded protein n=1 Tax=Dunaliella salina TaxID=3046 RepID=A0ABZ3KDM7_DUNSA|nr:hypothetical protein DUNSADRAFT_1002 [Dunaliella salina]|eukprot:KAF5827275.1 hypothetical protein DUNSADRAFT_1002 [Dunaliella salina]
MTQSRATRIRCKSRLLLHVPFELVAVKCVVRSRLLSEVSSLRVAVRCAAR